MRITMPPPILSAVVSFGTGLIGNSRGWPPLETLGACFLAVVVWIALYSIIAGRRPDAEAEDDFDLRAAARSLRNRPGRNHIDNTTMPPPLNKGKRTVRYRRIR